MRNNPAHDRTFRASRYKHALPGHMGLYVERRRTLSAVSWRALVLAIIGGAMLVFVGLSFVL